MFGIGTSEFVVIAIIVFLIYGPDRLPEMVKKTTKFIKDIRQVSEDVSGVIRREVHNYEIMTKYPDEPRNDGIIDAKTSEVPPSTEETGPEKKENT